MMKILNIAAAPTIAGLVASWFSYFVEAPLGFHGWNSKVANAMFPICSVLVFAILGFFLTKSMLILKRWALCVTGGFMLSSAFCIMVRWIVGDYLDGELVVTLVRDRVWPVIFAASLILMVSCVVLWAIYLNRVFMKGSSIK